MLAELLAGLVQRAVAEVAGGLVPAARQDPRLHKLPPPMAPNYEEDRASLCLQLVSLCSRGAELAAGTRCRLASIGLGLGRSSFYHPAIRPCEHNDWGSGKGSYMLPSALPTAAGRRGTFKGVVQRQRSPPVPATIGDELSTLPPPPPHLTPRTLASWTQGEFRGVVKRQRGFTYRPEKPLLPRWVEQKWGWSALEPGAGRVGGWVQQKWGWSVLELGALPGGVALGAYCLPFGSARGPAAASARQTRPACLRPPIRHVSHLPPHPPSATPTTCTAAGAWAELEVDTRLTGGSPKLQGGAKGGTRVQLSHLKSYSGMGTALIRCLSGCTCEPSILDGTTASHVSVFKVHSFTVRAWVAEVRG